MQRVVLTTILAAAGCWAQSTDAGSAAPAPPGPGVGAPAAQQAGGGRGGPQARASNEQAGVDIDRFIGYPVAKTAHLSHGTLLTHSILKAGDPYKPGPQGAVLEYRKELDTATLLPGSDTPLSTLPDAYFFYVK